MNDGLFCNAGVCFKLVCSRNDLFCRNPPSLPSSEHTLFSWRAQANREGMKNYKLSIEFSSPNDVSALAHAADVAQKLGGVVALIAPQKVIRVDETGTIVAIVKNKSMEEMRQVALDSGNSAVSGNGNGNATQREQLEGKGQESDLRLQARES